MQGQHNLNVLTILARIQRALQKAPVSWSRGVLSHRGATRTRGPSCFRAAPPWVSQVYVQARHILHIAAPHCLRKLLTHSLAFCTASLLSRQDKGCQRCGAYAARMASTLQAFLPGCLLHSGDRVCLPASSRRTWDKAAQALTKVKSVAGKMLLGNG